MLDQLNLRFFKCFERLDLPLAPLTLLSGANASGKSSALQALVLLHQTMREHEWSTRLMLNGGSVQLGTVLDVVDKVHGIVLYPLDVPRRPGRDVHGRRALTPGRKGGGGPSGSTASLAP